MEEVVDLSVLCRLCLSQDEVQFSVFEKWYSDENTTFDEMIKFCFSIEIRKEDLLPTRICQNCLSIIDQTYTFRQKCLETEQFLQERVNIYLTAPPMEEAEKVVEDIVILDSDEEVEEHTNPISTTVATIHAANQEISINLNAANKPAAVSTANGRDINNFNDVFLHEMFGDKVELMGGSEKALYRCHICSAPVNGHTAIIRHAYDHMDVMDKNDDKFKCAYCGWDATVKLRLQRHLHKHFNNKEFFCTNCSKNFKKKEQLQEHVYICSVRVPAVQN